MRALQTSVALAGTIAALLLAGCASGGSPAGSSERRRTPGRASAGQPSPAVTARDTRAARAEVRTLRRLLERAVVSLATKSSPGDSEFFAHGVWMSADETCWRCNVGPGTAAAVLWGTGTWRRAWLLRLAEQTFDTAIQQHQEEDGSFGPALGGESNNVIGTMFFSLDLGVADRELEPALGAVRAARWRTALKRAAGYLVSQMSGVYVNGNINLGTATVLRLTAAATGDRRWSAAFARELAFTLHPNASARSAGFGLRYTVSPSVSTDANGAGYLAERGVGAPGFDPEYTELQDDMASVLYAVDRGPESVRLLNLLTNVLLPRVDSSYRLHTYGGSRHGTPTSVVPFTTSALPILAFQLGRGDLVRRAQAQLARIREEIRNATRYPYRNSYRYLGFQSTALAVLAPAASTGTGGMNSR
jgi:hypothetical protein